MIPPHAAADRCHLAPPSTDSEHRRATRRRPRLRDTRDAIRLINVDHADAATPALVESFGFSPWVSQHEMELRIDRAVSGDTCVHSGWRLTRTVTEVPAGFAISATRGTCLDEGSWTRVSLRVTAAPRRGSYQVPGTAT